MPLPDIFNEFHFIICKQDGCSFSPVRTLNSKFDEIYNLIDKNGDITRIWYYCLYGTSLGVEYLTTETNTSGRKSIVKRSVIAESNHDIPKEIFIHDMYVHEQFLKYFKTCLKYNEPEIEVSK